MVHVLYYLFHVHIANLDIKGIVRNVMKKACDREVTVFDEPLGHIVDICVSCCTCFILICCGFVRLLPLPGFPCERDFNLNGTSC